MVFSFKTLVCIIGKSTISFRQFFSLASFWKDKRGPSSVGWSKNFYEETDLLFGPVRGAGPIRQKNLPDRSKFLNKGDENISASLFGKDITSFPSTFSVTDTSFLKELDIMRESSIKSASVSTILNVTMPDDSRIALEKWRKGKIKELGEDGFAEYQASLFQRGKALHKAVFDCLSGYTTFEETDVPTESRGHWQSLQHIFSKIKDPAVLEEKVTHPYLKYHGIVDCVCKINGKLVVIDWKTSGKKKLVIQHLYDNPVQVAAYIGAINFDPAFANKDLRRGAVVIAYENGTPADVFTFNSEKYWKIWLQRLSVYHSSNKSTLT